MFIAIFCEVIFCNNAFQLWVKTSVVVVNLLVKSEWKMVNWWLLFTGLLENGSRIAIFQVALHPDFYHAMHYSAKRTARCTIVQSAVLRLHVVSPSVCPSVMLVDQNHIRWKFWKIITSTISLTPSLFINQRPSTYSQENIGKFWGD